MAAILRRPRCNEDEGAACLYIALRNPLASDRVLNRLQKLSETIAEFPEPGVARLKSRPDARVFAHDDCVLLYRVPGGDAGISLVRLYGPREDREQSLIADVTSDTDDPPV